MQKVYLSINLSVCHSNLYIFSFFSLLNRGISDPALKDILMLAHRAPTNFDPENRRSLTNELRIIASLTCLRLISKNQKLLNHFYSGFMHRITIRIISIGITSLIFGPTDFGGWSYRFTVVSPLVTSFSWKLIGFLNRLSAWTPTGYLHMGVDTDIDIDVGAASSVDADVGIDADIA